MQEEINNEEPEMDLLGNDLYLIVETHEELINSLIGQYFKLYSKEQESTQYRDKIISLRKLKLELALRNHDIDFKKQTILALEKELKTLQNAKNDIVAEGFPKEKYNILNGSIPLTEEEKLSLNQDMENSWEWIKNKLNLKD